jgi:hypothetical protein
VVLTAVAPAIGDGRRGVPGGGTPMVAVVDTECVAPSPSVTVSVIVYESAEA